MKNSNRCALKELNDSNTTSMKELHKLIEIDPEPKIDIKDFVCYSRNSRMTPKRESESKSTRLITVESSNAKD